MPAHRKPQTRRNALYTALVLAVAVFVALIGFGGSPKHESPTAQTNTENQAQAQAQTQVATKTESPVPLVTTSTARSPLTPSPAAIRPRSSTKPKPTAKVAPKAKPKVTPKSKAVPKATSRPAPKAKASAKPTPKQSGRTPKATPRPKAAPSITSTGLGTSDASLKSLAARVQGQPVRIQIPALHVDASVIPVGVTDAGALEVPENVIQAAWFQAGSAPGQGGTAIIAAHVDFGGKLGLFNGLHNLKKGDLIYVTDFSRHIHRFVAVTGRLFPKSDPSTVQSLAAAAATPGHQQLALITCGGALDTQKHSYYDNFVLLANA